MHLICKLDYAPIVRPYFVPIFVAPVRLGRINLPRHASLPG
jgi:hypothetical protein